MYEPCTVCIRFIMSKPMTVLINRLLSSSTALLPCLYIYEGMSHTLFQLWSHRHL